MREYSFNDFKYICYVEGKDRAVKKLFASLRTDKEIAILNKRIQKDTINIENVYKEYLRGINGAEQNNI
ncbi:hypothetical protein K4A18_002626 [Listeria monocytogenes]|uniref:Uncharacterized protein n=1 Tax=Listeria monocytogenes TaxID=1639 RepID=A0A473U6V6_LISMN|nr:hypothetical protein [Listeria monocytogenes]AMD23162.1 hypothetical protein CG42_00655 [Listeria monocytogenes]EAC3099304.1 hypothetical protein [Listeria monocytogenes]EAC3113641.1 hypothetical protein [Listeria monocytogenes]EAC3121724.1 hypothetical protein [Listeria monocytogenes]EAC3167016.1 hypothetical protein [Listeria monocytogenes]